MPYSDLRNFELSVWLHMIGYSVISIFIPILMLIAGYSITMVMVYCAMFFLFDVPLNFLAQRLTVYLGARWVIVLATFSIILYFFLFHYLSNGNFLILITLASLVAIYDSFYWVAHLYLFMESSGKGEEISKNNGIITSIRSFGGMLGPAIGAGLLLFTTESALITVSIVFLTLSIVPLLYLEHTKNKPDSKKVTFKEFFKELPEKKNFLSWFLYSIHLGANEIIWPIFIFTIFGTLKSIALVAIIISISKILLSYISGIVRSSKREKIITIGIICTLLIWVLRVCYTSTIFFYLSILLVGFFTVLIEVPLDSNVFERARLKNQSLSASTFRNAIIMFPQGILFAVLSVLVGIFNISFLSAIVSLVLLLLIHQIILYLGKNKKAG